MHVLKLLVQVWAARALTRVHGDSGAILQHRELQTCGDLVVDCNDETEVSGRTGCFVCSSGEQHEIRSIPPFIRLVVVVVADVVFPLFLDYSVALRLNLLRTTPTLDAANFRGHAGYVDRCTRPRLFVCRAVLESNPLFYLQSFPVLPPAFFIKLMDGLSLRAR